MPRSEDPSKQDPARAIKGGMQSSSSGDQLGDGSWWFMVLDVAGKIPISEPFELHRSVKLADLYVVTHDQDSVSLIEIQGAGGVDQVDVTLTWDGDQLSYSSTQVDKVPSHADRLLTTTDYDSLDDVSPVIEGGNWVNGTVNNNMAELQWYVTKRQYVLTNVKLYFDSNAVIGLEVTFSHESGLAGWPVQTHLFGARTAQKKEKDIDFEVDEL